MKRLDLAVFLVLIMLLVGGIPNVGVAGEGGAGAIGAGTVVLSADEHQLAPGILRGFVATRSDRPECLVTLRETNSFGAGTSVFCGARVVDGASGVMITVSVPEGTAPGSFWVLTVLQDHANGYEPAVAYSGP